jgi:hypothetical protein
MTFLKKLVVILDCSFITYVAGVDDNLFDPINLDEKHMKYAKKIWTKYRPLRMKNRCYQANPMGIEEKQKRGCPKNYI